jgi:hypothetical protein
MWNPFKWNFLNKSKSKDLKSKDLKSKDLFLPPRTRVNTERENLYKKVVEDLRREQVGKEGAIHVDPSKLAKPTLDIEAELGIPPKIYKESLSH